MRASSRGMHSASNSAFSSCGGPGSSISNRSSPSYFPAIHWPGAVPSGFGITVALVRMSACFARQVVFRRAKATRKNNDVRTPHGKFRGRGQTFRVVAHNALEAHFNAQFIQLLGEVERVGVLAMGSEQ